MTDKVFAGTLSHPDKEGSLAQFKVKLVSFNREKDEYLMHFSNGEKSEEAVVKVRADAFEHGHYINPEYSMIYKGQKFSFKINNGEACYGYSAHLIAMIFSALIT